MERSAAVQCNLVGNPLHEEQLEIVRMLGDVMALNTVIDEERELVFVSFGEIIESHIAAVRFVAGLDPSAGAAPLQDRRHVRRGISARQDLLPDRQGHGDAARHSGARRHADRRIRLFGGVRVARSSGRRSVVLSRWGPTDSCAASCRKALADIDEWQTEMQLKPMRVGRIQLFTGGLPPEDRSLTGVEVVSDLDAAIRDAVVASGDGVAAFIPEGPYVIPKYVAA